MTVPEPETPAEALLAKADNCLEMADAQRELADKQNLAADKLEALAHALEVDAAQMLGNEIMDAGRGRGKTSVVGTAEVSLPGLQTSQAAA
jgi:tRNA(Met) C34 N-acetyltransferase TmcA